MFAAAIKTFTATIAPSYNIDSQPTCLSGPWKVFSATKTSTGQEVSVFIFERKTLAQHSGLSIGGRNGTTPAHLVQTAMAQLKAEATNLTRLRHPSILKLIEPVEETRTGGLMFVTERVTASLSTLLRRLDRNEDDDSQLSDVEIQKGLVQVGKALEFLHNSAHLVHGNLTPASILVDSKGDWKLAGLAFAGPDGAPSTSLRTIDHALPDSLQVDMNYAAPDLVIDDTVGYAGDMFSLGLVIASLFNEPHESPIQVSSTVSSYRRIFSAPSTTPSRTNRFLCNVSLPEPIVDLLGGLITRSPLQRLNAQEFQRARYFDNVLVSTLQFLEEFPAKTVDEKSQFMRGLPRVLTQFSASILEKNFIPVLLEQLKDPTLLSLAVQCIFNIVERLPPPRASATLAKSILPELNQILLCRDTRPDRKTAQDGGLSIIVKNLQLLAKAGTEGSFKKYALPLYLACFQEKPHALIDSALKNLRYVIDNVDGSTIKSQVFPLVSSVFSKTTSLAVKVTSLDAFQILCGGHSGSAGGAVLDKFTIQDKIVPLLKGIKTKEPEVMMATLSVLDQVGKIADIRFVASDILPLLWIQALGPLLNLAQFEKFMTLINRLSQRVAEEHSRSLRELSSTLPADQRAISSATSRPGPVGEVDFHNLVNGRNKASSTVTVSRNPNSSRPSPTPTGGSSSVVPLVASKLASTTLQPAPSASMASTIDWSGAKRQLNSSSIGMKSLSNNAIRSSAEPLKPMKPPGGSSSGQSNNRSPAFMLAPPPKPSSQPPYSAFSSHSLLDD